MCMNGATLTIILILMAELFWSVPAMGVCVIRMSPSHTQHFMLSMVSVGFYWLHTACTSYSLPFLVLHTHTHTHTHAHTHTHIHVHTHTHTHTHRHFKAAGAGYYNKILSITKHGNVYDRSVQFLIVR